MAFHYNSTQLPNAHTAAKMPRTFVRPQLGERFRLALPPHREQRKIAAILSSVDDAIEKTQAVIDQVQVVKRGLMQELLTRGLPGRHTRFKQTEIGEIPEEWEIVRLGDVASVTSVGNGCRKGRPFAPSVTPYLATFGGHVTRSSRTGNVDCLQRARVCSYSQKTVNEDGRRYQ